MKTLFVLLFALLLSVSYTNTSKAQLKVDTINSVLTPEALVQDFVLSGVTVSNVVFTGHASALGWFSNGNTTNIGLEKGIILSSGKVVDAIGPNNDCCTPGFNSTPGDPDLKTISNVGVHGGETYDAAVLSFDLVPVGNILEFEYVFASEEYPEYVCSPYNDAFGFFISGHNIQGPYSNNAINIALIPGKNIPVAINTVNNGIPSPGTGDISNCSSIDPDWQINAKYYRNNGDGTTPVINSTIEYDGFTTVLLAQLEVKPGSAYHLKMAVGDAGDEAYDSGVFLKSKSMKSYDFSAIVGSKQKDATVSIYPNPVTAQSVMSYTLEQNEQVRIELYNIHGEKVKVITDENQAKGEHQYSLDFIKEKGMYFLKVQVGEKSMSRSIIIN